jgi:hypothetical protein
MEEGYFKSPLPRHGCMDSKRFWMEEADLIVVDDSNDEMHEYDMINSQQTIKCSYYV